MGPEEHSPPDTTANRAPYERIVELVCDHMGIKSRTVGLQTSLQRIGMDGDDAVAFMSRFAEEFRVDMKNFNFTKYFGLEGLWLAGLWKKQSPLTISDLVAVAKSGVWPEQPK